MKHSILLALVSRAPAACSAVGYTACVIYYLIAASNTPKK